MFEVKVLSAEESADLYATSLVAVDHPFLASRAANGKVHLDALVASIGQIDLVNREQEQWASDRMGEAHAVVKDLEEERKRMTEGLLRDKRAIDGAYQAAREPWERVVGLLKDKLAQALLRRHQAAEQALLAAQEAAQSGDSEACQTALASIPEDHKLTGASGKLTYTYALVDIRKVPAEYLQVNDKAVKELCKVFDKTGKSVDVPGLAFSQKVSTRITSSRK